MRKKRLRRLLSKSALQVRPSPGLQCLTLTFNTAREVERIKNWISSTDYRRVFEWTTRQRHPETGDWVLTTPEYLEWRDATFDEDRANNLMALQQNFLQRILFLLGDYF